MSYSSCGLDLDMHEKVGYMTTLIDSVNAFTQLLPTPMGSLVGPLVPYTFAVKDVFDIKGFKTQAGNPDYLDQTFIANKTAPSVTLLQNAGAKLVGKTHTDELGGSLFGLNDHYGAPINANSPKHVPGGSSSGSAAAVAAHLVDFSLGADTSGSVRAPASFCGIFGFRPTHNVISTECVLPISNHLDTVGIFARDPDVISQVLNAYGMKDDKKLRRLRIIPSLIEQLEGLLKNKFQEKINLIQERFHSTQLVIDLDTLKQWSDVIRTIAMYGLWQVHKDWILKSNPTFGQIINDRISLARSIRFDDYKDALKKQSDIRQFMDDKLEPDDIAVFPTIHDIPPLLSTSIDDLKDFALKASRHTCIAALTGFPEITLPIRNIKNACSLGMSFLGKTGNDYSLSTFSSKVHRIMKDPSISIS